VARFAVLDKYVKRCEARPAFQKALRDQLAGYARNARSLHDGRLHYAIYVQHT